VIDGKAALIAGVTRDLTARIKAGDLANFVAQQWAVAVVAGRIWRRRVAVMSRNCLRQCNPCKAGCKRGCPEYQPENLRSSRVNRMNAGLSTHRQVRFARIAPALCDERYLNI
jgi:hypothetical protein